MSSIVWLTWKDGGHPAAGGAETICHEICTRLVAEGHHVTLLTCGYDAAPRFDRIDGIDVIRVGRSRYWHPFQALGYYFRHLRNTCDVLIEEVNGAAPYFSVMFEQRARKFLLYHQLGRTNWRYEVPVPFGYLGYYVLAPLASRIAACAGAPVITVSESTREVLANHGFAPQRTQIISEGIPIAPVPDLQGIQKYPHPTLLSLGAMRAMKRTLDQVRAFELAKRALPNLRLHLAGSASGRYGRKVLQYIAHSPHAADITYLGKVNNDEKVDLMRRSHVMLQTAVEEGWGLTITEAASQGTPAVAYDVAGLRDSIRHLHTGVLTAEQPRALATAVTGLLSNHSLYHHLRRSAWQWSKQITFDRSYQDFKRVLELA